MCTLKEGGSKRVAAAWCRLPACRKSWMQSTTSGRRTPAFSRTPRPPPLVCACSSSRGHGVGVCACRQAGTIRQLCNCRFRHAGQDREYATLWNAAMRPADGHMLLLFCAPARARPPSAACLRRRTAPWPGCLLCAAEPQLPVIFGCLVGEGVRVFEPSSSRGNAGSCLLVTEGLPPSHAALLSPTSACAA